MPGFGIGGGGPQQIIGGQSYAMYSPQWYEAMDANKVHKAGVAGTAANTFANAANPALAGLQSSLAGMFGGAGGGATGTSGGSAFGTGSSVGTNGAGTSGVSGGAPVGQLQLPDQSGKTNAIYATAKDQVGKSGRASVTALRDELGATGALGGGAEVQGTRDIIANAAGDLGQVSRDQAGKQADLSADFAKTNYAGGITQRGQDVSASEAQARLAQESRLADANLAFQKQQAASSQQLQMLQLALSGLKGMPTGEGLY